MVGGDGGSGSSGRFIIMEKTGDKLTKQNNQQSDLYNYNLDHVYCSDNSRYRSAGTTHLNITAAASDLKALRKENKQLQAMLLLHLDLIQEQSNQLIAKDKQLIQLREENAQLRLKCERSPAVNEQRRPNNAANISSSSSSSNRQLNTAIATASTTIQNVGHRILNTSAGSPTIDTYFTTTSSHSDPKVSTIRTHQHENIHPKFKTIGSMNTLSSVLFNNHSGSGGGNSGQIILNENQAVHEMRNNNSQQTIYPTIKVEANAMQVDDTKLIRKHAQHHVLNSVGPMVKDRYKVVTTTTTSGSANNSVGGGLLSHDKTVKYRAIDGNNVIGHNNGKIISKIILQRKRSENGEKIFVRTKNIEIGSNNRVNYGKWSPLRTIKSEVIDNDINENENDAEPEPEPEIELALDTAVAAVAADADTTMATAAATSTPPSPEEAEATASPNPTINDDEISSDVPNADYVLTPTSTGTLTMQLQSTTATSSSSSSASASHQQLASASHSLPPSSSSSASSTSSSIRSTLVEQSDASVSECQIDSIKIEQEIDDILDESNPHCMSFDLNSTEKLNDTQAEESGISPYDDDADVDGDGDDIDDDDDEDPNTLNYSQDTSNIESPRASESMQCIPLSSSPVTSTVSTSDYTHCDLFGGTHFDSNSSTQTGMGGVGLLGGGGSGSGGAGYSGGGGGGGTTILYPMAKRHINRNAFLTTRKPYIIRDWQLDEIEAELKQEITDEICKEENEANLELPKWRTWEMSSNRESPVPREYEDLSDDAFARRHARFLLDERKRKKWDVQRIREQRTIERLKRRHCKDELNQQKDMNKMYTFYPTVDQLKTIQITDDLPVSAFGEPIPLLPFSEFSLPWHFNQTALAASMNTTTANTTTTSAALTNDSMSLRNEQQCGVPLAVPPDYTSRPNSNSSSALQLEPITPSNVSSIIFLSKRRSGRTRTSISQHNQTHPNVKCIT